MASYNRIILMGNLTRDPELTYTPSNTAICKFGIATNNKWRDREGNAREDVCFVDCTVFGKAGETFNQYMRKGRSVLIEGRLQLDRWTSKEGEKRSKHAVLVDNFTFVGSRGGDEGGAGGGHAQSAAPPPAQGGDGGGGGWEQPSPPSGDGIPF